jgi:glycine oxidase
MLHADICVAGAGIIGLSLALELHHRGARVIVAEASSPLQQASTAAAGMLAAEDPDNPPQLLTLSRYSRALYPEFLARIEHLSGISVPFQTSLTLQQREHPRTAAVAPRATSSRATSSIDEISAEMPLALASERIAQLLAPGSNLNRFQLLREHSIDPRQLAPALLAAIRATSIQLLTDSPVRSTRATPNSVRIETASGTIEAGQFVDCRGAWTADQTNDQTTGFGNDVKVTAANESAYTVVPVKGQMLALAIPPELPLDITFRAERFYIVPRLHGPQAGRAIVGATVEHVGFDKTVHPSDIAALHARAAALVPGLASARIVDTWAGLRPATSDRLPLLGAHPTKPHHFIATGHFRNGILLAPATALVMADLLLHQPHNNAPLHRDADSMQSKREHAIDLSAFSPSRFAKERLSLA